MKKVYFVGLDIAKNVFQLFLADEKGKQLGNRKMSRSQMESFFVNLPPCIIGMEACGTSHHWVRVLTSMGHTPKLIQPNRVKAFLGLNNKTDAADAKAICEALMHPGTTFVRPKTIAQQDIDHLLSRRQRLVDARTCLVNQTRAFLMERGVVIPQGISRFKSSLPIVCAKHWEEFSSTFQAVLTENCSEFNSLNAEIERLDTLIESNAKQNEACKRLMTIPGIGPLTSTALLSQVNDGKQFNNGRQMAAYFGLTPKERSSGGKQRLLGITKRGNTRIRYLLVLAARSIMTGIGSRKCDANGTPYRLSPFDAWVIAMKKKVGIFKAAVAIANKLARIAWAVLSKNEPFMMQKAPKATI